MCYVVLFLCDLGEIESDIRLLFETFFLVKPHRFVFIFFGLMISKDLDFLLQILYVRCEGKRQNVWYV